MFIGSYQNQLDAKYRMIIPSKYRKELCPEDMAQKCIVTKGIDRCLYLYPISEWEKFAEKLAGLPKADSKARNFVRHFYGNAEECEMDKQGRITLPEALRAYARIDKELTTIGNGEKIEIWSHDVYENSDIVTDMDGDDIAQGMADYGI